MDTRPVDYPAWKHGSWCDGGACVDVAILDEVVLVRDSADPRIKLSVLTVNRAVWREFLARTKNGQFDYLGLEQDAVAITSYTTYYVPALLQTEEYTKAIIKAIAPKMDPGIYEQRVEARMRRQQVLEKDKPPRYRVLLDEAVLHHDIGGRTVMIAQLEKAWRLSGWVRQLFR